MLSFFFFFEFIYLFISTIKPGLYTTSETASLKSHGFENANLQWLLSNQRTYDRYRDSK
jgi:hypothetical protein